MVKVLTFCTGGPRFDIWRENPLNIRDLISNILAGCPSDEILNRQFIVTAFMLGK